MNTAIFCRRILFLCCLIALPAHAAPAPGALAEAAGKGDAARVKRLLADGASPDDRGSKNATALMIAIATGKNDVVKALLDAGANPHLVEAEYVTALHAAATVGNLEAIRLLLAAHADVNASATMGKGVTPLMIALRYRQWDAAKVLLAGGATLKATPIGAQALLYALAPDKAGLGQKKQPYLDIAFAQTLIDLGAAAKIKDISIANATVLQLACAEHQPDMAAFLLKEDLDPNLVDDTGNSPLLAAAHVSVSEGLTQAMAWEDTPTNRQWMKDYEAKGYAPPPTPLAQLMMGTPAMKAAFADIQARRKRTLELLLAAGADIQHADNRGMTALAMAYQSMDLAAMETLLKAKADANVLWLPKEPKTKPGTTLLMQAVQDGRLKSVQLLVAHGADINRADQGGTTPLQAATKRGEADIIAALQAAVRTP
ncbi:MAG TPA: ankyrin repeat domain-containing protein [Rhizomicrobium sp.]|nr:ankyrin repeat domain-containing protein [Rhizomicrobium sp.]